MNPSLNFSVPHAPLCSQMAESCMLQRYLIEALTLQQLEPLLDESAEARELVARLLTVLRHNAAELAELLKPIPTSRHELEECSVRLSGMFVGSLCKRRAREVPLMLRNDFALLNLVAMNYTILHTNSLALQDTNMATLALTHLQQLVAIARDIARLMPSFVMQELKTAFGGLSKDAEQLAHSNIQAAWQQGVSAA